MNANSAEGIAVATSSPLLRSRRRRAVRITFHPVRLAPAQSRSSAAMGTRPPGRRDTTSILLEPGISLKRRCRGAAIGRNQNVGCSSCRARRHDGFILKIHHKDTKTQRSHKAGIVRAIEQLCAVFVSSCLCGESDFPAHRTCLQAMVRRRGRDSSRAAKILQVSSADPADQDADSNSCLCALILNLRRSALLIIKNIAACKNFPATLA